ncbi:hypothetical protein SDC9_197542 [bioreactor metagenome]|uniref:Uncharacterized protein n=1 Tax=bioreactor metagenome TaxID=1076179 RepID=A0A645IF37_9ZZZZ
MIPFPGATDVYVDRDIHRLALARTETIYDRAKLAHALRRYTHLHLAERKRRHHTACAVKDSNSLGSRFHFPDQHIRKVGSQAQIVEHAHLFIIRFHVIFMRTFKDDAAPNVCQTLPPAAIFIFFYKPFSSP